VVALYTLGCFFGALSCIGFGDKLGRIRTMMLGAAVQTVGAIIQASSFSLGQLIVGRFVSGLGLGALSATAPNWQSECSKAEHRGSTVLVEGVFISLGLSIAAWVTFGLSHTTGSVSWRFPLALAGLWSLILIAIVRNLPESPRWLIKKGHIDEAREVLGALDNLPGHSEDINYSIKEIEESLLITGNGRFKDILQNGPQRLFHRACLAAAGQLFQQMSGINAIAFYISTIFEQYLGLTPQDARILGASVFTFQTLCSPIGVLTVDRFGRRKLMLFASVGMGCCMAVLAGTVSHPDNRAAIIVAGLFIFLFSFFFPTGFLGLTFLYATEVSPLSVRVPITSISTGTAWLINFVVAEVTPVGFATIHARYYIVYAAMNFCLILPCKLRI
jgi:sugar porter (SP) family MFS transporter